MEAELDMLVKEKEQSVQMAAIPLEAVPVTGVSTTTTTTTEIPSTIPIKERNASEKSVKSMEDITCKGKKLKYCKKRLKTSRR